MNSFSKQQCAYIMVGDGLNWTRYTVDATQYLPIGNPSSKSTVVMPTVSADRYHSVLFPLLLSGRSVLVPIHPPPPPSTFKLMEADDEKDNLDHDDVDDSEADEKDSVSDDSHMVTVAPMLSASPPAPSSPSYSTDANLSYNLPLPPICLPSSATPSPSRSPAYTPSPVTPAYTKTLFQPEYPARARLNVYVAKATTDNLLSRIAERGFANSQDLYHYIDFSTALQINDDQMSVFSFSNPQQRFVLANFDLHDKQTDCTLYAVIVDNERSQSSHNRWLWCLQSFLTAKEICQEYGISPDDLPKSSRGMKLFRRQLCDEHRDMDMLNESVDDVMRSTHWPALLQITNGRRHDRQSQNSNVLKLREATWKKQCARQWSTAATFPIVVNDNRELNAHWIEWIKLIPIRNGRATHFVGVCCRFEEQVGAWQVTALCLDKGDMLNKSRLCGAHASEQTRNQAPQFGSPLNEIQFF